MKLWANDLLKIKKLDDEKQQKNLPTMQAKACVWAAQMYLDVGGEASEDAVGEAQKFLERAPKNPGTIKGDFRKQFWRVDAACRRVVAAEKEKRKAATAAYAANLKKGIAENKLGTPADEVSPRAAAGKTPTVRPPPAPHRAQPRPTPTPRSSVLQP